MALRFGTLTSNNEMETPTGLGADTWMTPEFWQQGQQDLIAALASGSAGQVQGGFRPEDFQPLGPNTPSFEEWLASQGEGYQPTGDNTPEYEYLQQNYTMPSYGGRGLTNLPLLAMAGVGGLAASGFGLGGLEGTAALSGATAPVGAALGSEAAIADLVATGMSPEAAAAAVASGGETISPFAGLGGTGTGLMAGAAGTPISRLFGLGQTGSDILSVAGAVAPGVLGYFGADKVSDAYRDSQNQYLGLGAPSRGRLEASYQPGFSLLDQPGYGDALNRVADISARGYSAKFGNPAGSPAAQAGILSDVWNQGYIPALANYRGQLMQAGGMGLNTSGQASLLGANAEGGPLDAIGIGLGRLMNPQPSLEDLLRQANRLTIGGRTYG